MINHRFQKTIRETRDEFYRRGMPDSRNVPFNLVCGIEAFRCINVADNRESFAKTGILPFEPCIGENFKTFEENTKIEPACAAERFQGPGPAWRVQSVRKGHTHKETFLKNLPILLEGRLQNMVCFHPELSKNWL